MGHRGIVKYRARANASVWWLGLSSQIENLKKIALRMLDTKLIQKKTFVCSRLSRKTLAK